MQISSPQYARAAILGYLEGRCDVSSQHKLPTRNDLYASETANIFDMAVFMDVVEELILEGVIRTYGDVYLSDREINVL